MKIAYRLSGLELLFHESVGHIFCPIVRKGSAEEKFAKIYLKQGVLLSVSCTSEFSFAEASIEDIVRNTDLGKILNRAGVRYLLLKQSNDFFTKWGRTYGITLLSPNYSISQKFENKIFFDHFLEKCHIPKPKSFVIKKRGTSKPFQKTVIQTPESSGGEGTWITSSQKEYNEILQKQSLPLLVRKYEKGISVGSSFFVTKKTVYYSALDRQCFYRNPVSGSCDFVGIQWMKYDFFPRLIQRRIQDFLFQIGSAFQKIGVRGMVNVDYIISKEGKIFCLECNPRLTFASNQVFSQVSVNGGVDFLDLYFHKKEQKMPLSIPKNTFVGAQMLISFPLKTKFPHVVKRIIPSGFFVIKEKKIQKVPLDHPRDFLHLDNGFFYYNEIEKGDRYEKSIQIGTVVSNFPLYSPKTGRMNVRGRMVYQYFHK